MVQTKPLLTLCMLILSALETPALRVGLRPSKLGLRRTRHFAASDIEKSPQEEEKLASMVKMIMTAVDEGREDDLKDAGLKVTKRTAKEVMDSNLSNEEIVNKVLGPMTDAEEVELMRQLQHTQNKIQEDDSGKGFEGAVAGIDPAFLAELKSEALGVVGSIQKERSVIAKEMGISDDEMGAASSFLESSDEAGIGNERLLSPVEEMDTPPGESPFIPVGNMGEEDNVEEIERENTRIDEENKKADEENDREERESGVSAAAGEEGVVPARIIAMAAVEEATAGLSADEKVSAQETFSSLLKASMDAQVEAGEAGGVDEDVQKATIDAVAGGDLAALDVKSLLGDSLSMLTDSLGIDMAAELSDPKTRTDMQAILEGGMSELAANMKELDEQNEALYQQLGSLERELREETQAFNEKKSGELEDLLAQQSSFQQDLDASRVKVEASAAQLEGLMADLEEKADVLTALALFPVKRVDKKAAFVLGLGTVFKTLYNLSEMLAVRSTDPSDWLNIITQVGLVFVFFSHYGLVKAMGRSALDATLPPPPPEAET